MDFPRLQIAALSLIVIISSVIFLDLGNPITIIVLVVIGFCFFWQLWWVLPYTPLWQKQVKSCDNEDYSRQISVLTSNVLVSNRDPTKLFSLIDQYKPDMLVILESDHWWHEQLKKLSDEMPYSVEVPLENAYGMHIYSKLKLYKEKISYLVQDDVPSIHSTVELRSGDMVSVHFVHPAPPSPTENSESIERDAELVIVARSVEKSNEPLIVTGDLNDVAWSRTTRLFSKISDLLDPRVGRGMFNTFHAQYPLLRWPLDHIFHSKHFTLRTMKRLSYIGSDHFPLYTSLSFTPLEGKDQDGAEADMEDYQNAKEIAEEENVVPQDVPEPKGKN